MQGFDAGLPNTAFTFMNCPGCSPAARRIGAGPLATTLRAVNPWAGFSVTGQSSVGGVRLPGGRYVKGQNVCTA